MKNLLIIGAGGVGNVVAHKAVMSGAFDNICLASRTLSKCEAVKRDILSLTGYEIEIAQVDADNADETAEIIKRSCAGLVINVALPYQDLSVMDACLQTGASYLDTANYEPPNEAKFEYSWQWDYRNRFKDKGITAILGCGFDPGVTNVFCAYLLKHYFDEIHYIDILDCNAGNHGKAFATNFNPEINIREVTQVVRHWDSGRWIETPPILDDTAVHFSFNYPEVGNRESYLLYHEEEESLVKHIKGLKRIRFWMTFSEQYLTHLKVLHNVGMTGIEPVEYEGKNIVPLKFLKAVLPEPSSLGEDYKGKTVIGVIASGVKDGKKKSYYIYNICDHAKCYEEVKAQAVSYTTGVPAVIGAKLFFDGTWNLPGVFNVEEFDPDKFMEHLNNDGLGWKIEEIERRDYFPERIG